MADDSDDDAHRHKRARKEGAGGPPVKLTRENYFTHNAQFSRWLQRKRGVFLNDLPTDEAHRLFDKFARRWNAGDLDDVQTKRKKKKKKK